MRTFLLGATLSLALAAATGAMAQPGIPPSADPSVAASAVGHWLHGPHGDIIGSVRNLTDGDRTAVVMVGSYFRPGSHEVRVPASQLSVADGQVTLRAQVQEALNVWLQR